MAEEKNKEAVEEEIITKLEAGLESYAMEQLTLNGRRSWPENPFTALSKLPPDYDADLYILSQMKDRDWIFTGDGNNPAFNNKIAHLRKSDSIAVWGYDPATGVLDYEGAPFMPVNILHRVTGTGGN